MGSPPLFGGVVLSGLEHTRNFCSGFYSLCESGVFRLRRGDGPLSSPLSDKKGSDSPHRGILLFIHCYPNVCIGGNYRLGRDTLAQRFTGAASDASFSCGAISDSHSSAFLHSDPCLGGCGGASAAFHQKGIYPSVCSQTVSAALSRRRQRKNCNLRLLHRTGPSDFDLGCFSSGNISEAPGNR